MKAYTDIEQSKKLAEILPIESADMTYDWAVIDKEYSTIPYCRKPIDDELPCWSLAALIDSIPKQVTLSGSAEDSYWYCKCEDAFNHLFVDSNNPIDACYEMILRLHELKML
jgi:hypothetical protein